MDSSIFSDATRIGPGIWFNMHIEASNATTDARKTAFQMNINNLCDNFKCKKCQLHFRKFIDTHPFVLYWHIYDSKNRDIGFFQWTWELHNEVNKFLGKYQPSFDEAYQLYTDSELGACFNCGNEGHSEPRIEQRSRAIPPILSLYRADSAHPRPFQLVRQN